MRQESLLNFTDTANDINSSLAKAHSLCQELCDCFFQYAGLPFAAMEEHRDFILWEYNRYATYAYIVQDYIIQAEADMVNLSGIAMGGLCPPGSRG